MPRRPEGLRHISSPARAVPEMVLSELAGADTRYARTRMASLSDVVGRFPDGYGEKGLKFLAVSAFNVVVGQSLLVLANAGFGWSFVPSNVFAVGIGAGPAYVLSRYWVWQKAGKSHFWKEVVPFWSLAFLGLVLSTILVAVAETYSNTTVVLMGTNLFEVDPILWTGIGHS